MTIAYDFFPLFSGNDGALIHGNPGMRKSGNPGCPGIETLVDRQTDPDTQTDTTENNTTLTAQLVIAKQSSHTVLKALAKITCNKVNGVHPKMQRSVKRQDIILT